MNDELLQAYNGRRVLVTGHTGFKGSWLTIWLDELGAEVYGYALAPPTTPSLFQTARVDRYCRHREGDVRHFEALRRTIADVRPEFIFHLAAQPLVGASYEAPLETIDVNVLGTANLLEAVRQLHLRCAIVIVTSDKCYENREWSFGYRETDPMGGHDVYSMSKGAAELIVASYRRSFFEASELSTHGVALASARSGNVLGGGDWASQRLVPDIVRALEADQPVKIRHPHAVRPWQHVLEPLGGYLLLGARLAGLGTESPSEFCEAWNFGPAPDSTSTVGAVVDAFVQGWGAGRWVDASDPNDPHEAMLLRLAIDKAVSRLGWRPRWDLRTCLSHTIEWYRQNARGGEPQMLAEICREQIRAYVNTEDSIAAAIASRSVLQ